MSRVKMHLPVQHTLGYGMRIDAADKLPVGLRMLFRGPDFPNHG